MTLVLPPGQVWMIDDEAELVRATVGMLAREVGEAHIRGSTDSREVAGWIDRERPAALITDVRMPHLNGLELVTRLHQRWGAVPVVVMTAFPTPQVDEEARAGRFAYLPKPFTFQSLREALQRVFARPAPSAFSGAIAVSMLGEVVQLYGLASRTGTLNIDSPAGRGTIGFESGRVVDARTSSARGVSAFNEILSWTSGSFGWQTVAPTETTIQVGLSELLIDAYRLRDEREAGASMAGEIDSSLDDAFGAFEDVATGAAAAPEIATSKLGSNIGDNLKKLERADGFLGAGLFDISADTCVASIERAPGANVEAIMRGHVPVLEAKRRTIVKLSLNDEIEDIVITLSGEYHLLRMCRRQPACFFFLKLERSRANLAMARYQLGDVDRDTVL